MHVSIPAKASAWTVLALLCSGLVASSAAPASGKVDFARDVLPILSDKCFHCHGPDEKTQKAKLRLDTEQGMFRSKDGVTNVVRGKPADSELVRRVLTRDENDMMPPPDSHRSLTDAQKETLKRWVEQGAPWGIHWAFTTIQMPPAPVVKNKRWAMSDLDRFILAPMEAAKLKPSPEAAREQLIRRATFDLTGLPPTLSEIDAFLTDKSANAWERVVDRLLQSPSYGEHMAREWMDLARYADTFGYQADVDVDLSPWRDWVIRSYNENLSYDQFILWQLAGDLLKNPTRDQRLATTFNRLHRQTNEGGSIEEEFRTEYVADRVHTMGTAFLSLTLECARCHDHKYDPISQKDYYSLSAFFNNIDESGLYSHFTRAMPTPTMFLYTGDQEAKHNQLKAQIRELESQLPKTAVEARKRYEVWTKQRTDIPFPRPVASYMFDVATNNLTPNGLGTNQAQLVDAPKQVAGVSGSALQFSGDNSVICKGVGDFKRTDAFSFSLKVKPTENQSRAVVFHHSRAWSDSGSRGYELVLEDERPFFGLIHFWPGNAIAVRAKSKLPLNEWSDLVVTYDGSSRASGINLYRNGVRMEVEVVRDNLYRDITHRAEWGDADAGKIDLTLAGRFRDNGFKNGLIDSFSVYDICLAPDEVAMDRPQSVPDMFSIYLNHVDVPYRELQARLKSVREEENALANSVREIMVMQELPEPRPTFLLKRGAYDAPGDRVTAGTPERILPFPSEYPRNRLGLAKWMIDPKNPLTARVAVNRIWKRHFGKGLVATVENFGAQAQRPTHPELLDWLAARFIQSGWDRKALHKMILMSATYRQSSVPDAKTLEADPENLLYARGPRHRLSAEEIRDGALAVSGLLDNQIGGPSVKPYQPPGLWEESGTGKTYVQDKGVKLYRRSLYTFWRRTAPPPSMLSFDATSREVCTAKRDVTTTPLQALVLLNDVQFIEAARVLGEKLLKEQPADESQRIETAFRILTGRRPEKQERVILGQLVKEQREYFSGKPEAADRLLAMGERSRDKSLPAVDAAVTTVLVSALMNHDEFVMER
ncbi:MAG TPA: DUF1553 domain-containing protein [Roseimicrobium sp.]|nr:DUF1553 domain-containing protein [Roseimicrobium sp.]